MAKVSVEKPFPFTDEQSAWRAVKPPCPFFQVSCKLCPSFLLQSVDEIKITVLARTGINPSQIEHLRKDSSKTQVS